MKRGQYEVTPLGEGEAPRLAGCRRPGWLFLLLLLLLLVLAAAAAATVLVLQRQARHRSAIYAADGSRLFRGGVNITEGDLLDLNTSSGVLSGTRDPARLWPLGEVPYRADPAIGCPGSARCEALLAAMAEFANRTCVRWRTTEEQRPPALQIRYRPDSGCHAHVGYRGSPEERRPQLLVLGNGCFNRGILLHLLGHTLGLWHEHNRPDRDRWLDINMTNVEQRHVDSFRTFTLNQHRVVDNFDYSSVMMFGGSAFSDAGAPTMRPHWSAEPLLPVWRKTRLSEQDVHRVQAMYIKQCSRRRREGRDT